MLLAAGTSVAGGALAARLEALWVVLLPLSIVSLGVGYYFAYWRGMARAWERVLLWISTVVAAFFWVLPLLFPILQGWRTN